MDNAMKPSNFLGHPWGSVTQNAESEIIARNIMVMLSRNGDSWRLLSWEEYAAERVKDGASLDNVENERPYFDKVVGFCVTAEHGNSFAPGWGEP